MKIKILNGCITITEGNDELDVSDAVGKVQKGNLYTTPIGDGAARFVKSATAKVVYSLDGNALKPEYLEGVDAVLTIEGSDLAKQSGDLGIEVEYLTLKLDQITADRLAVMSDGDVVSLHQRVHKEWDKGE